MPTAQANAQKIGIMFSESSEKYADTVHPAGKYKNKDVSEKVDYSSTYDKELKAYHMYQQLGFDVHKVNEAMLNDLSSLKQFDAIVFPYTVMMNHTQRENVKAFVQAGGGAVFAFQTARNESAHFPQAGKPDISPLIFHVDSWVFEWDNLTEVFQSRFIDDVRLRNFDVVNTNQSHPIIQWSTQELGRNLKMTDTKINWVEIIKPWQNQRSNIQPILFFKNYDYTDKEATMNSDTFGAAHAIQYGKGRVVQIGFKIMDYIDVVANDHWEEENRGHSFVGHSGSDDAKVFMKNALKWSIAPNNSNAKRYYNLSLYTDQLQAYISPNGFVYRATATIKNNGNVPARGTLKAEVFDQNNKRVGVSHERYIPGLAADATTNNADRRDISVHREKFEIYMKGLPAGTYTVRVSFTEGRPDQTGNGFNFKTMAETKTFTRKNGSNNATFANVPMFRDVPINNPAYYDIKNLYATGIVTGYGDHTYKLQNAITRVQAATMILRALHIQPTRQHTLQANDLQKGQYGYDVLATAAKYGIVSLQNGRINAQAPMTRGDMAQALTNGFQLRGISHKAFHDVPTSSPYYNYVQTLAALAITTGYEDQTFRPNHPVNRQNFAQFINRTLYFQSK